MKLIFVITDFGSYNNFLSELSNSIVLDGKIELHIICSQNKVIDIDNKFENESNNLTFHFIDLPRTLSPFRQIRVGWRINKKIKEIGPDLVHAHFTTATFTTLLFKGNYLHWGTFHGLGFNSTSGLKKLVFSVVELFCFLRLDKIILINNIDFKVSKKLFPHKVFKSGGVGCDLEKFNINNYEKRDLLFLRKKMNVENQKVISFVGRFVEFKGFHLVYRIYKELNSASEGKFILLLVGGFDEIHKSGLSLNELQDLQQDRNVKIVNFTSRVNDYLAMSDYFIFPSKKEGLSTVVMEALSMGIVVLSFNVRGISDLIEDGINGYLLKVGGEEVERFCKKVEFLESGVINLSLVRNNSIKSRKKYDRKKFVLEQTELYREVLSRLKT
jgi:glycosyltransferase involved in cell wall biosynthesis